MATLGVALATAVTVALTAAALWQQRAAFTTALRLALAHAGVGLAKAGAALAATSRLTRALLATTALAGAAAAASTALDPR